MHVNQDFGKFVEPAARHAFLLRVWSESSGPWRVMLQHVRSRESYSFRDLAEAFAFIESYGKDGEAE